MITKASELYTSSIGVLHDVLNMTRWDQARYVTYGHPPANQICIDKFPNETGRRKQLASINLFKILQTKFHGRAHMYWLKASSASTEMTEIQREMSLLQVKMNTLN